MREANRTRKWAVAAALALGISAAAKSNGEGGALDTPEGGRAAEVGVTPGAYPISRYEGLWKASLFAAGEKAEPAEAEAPPGLSLVGVFEVDGVEHAVLMDTASGVTEEVDSAGANAGGSRLAKIESSPDLMKTRVQVERGGSLVWVGYQLGATVKASAQQSKAERLRVLQEKQRAMAEAARQGAEGGGGGEVGAKSEQPETKAERPRTVVLPSTIPTTARPQ